MNKFLTLLYFLKNPSDVFNTESMLDLHRLELIDKLNNKQLFFTDEKSLIDLIDYIFSFDSIGLKEKNFKFKDSLLLKTYPYIVNSNNNIIITGLGPMIMGGCKNVVCGSGSTISGGYKNTIIK